MLLYIFRTAAPALSLTIPVEIIVHFLMYHFHMHMIDAK